jgi:hypothetical protein
MRMLVMVKATSQSEAGELTPELRAQEERLRAENAALQAC